MKEEIMTSQVKNFSMSFKDIKIIEISFTLNPDYKFWENEAKGWKGSVFEHEIEIEIAHNINEQEKALRVLLGINVKAINAPFQAFLKSVGVFIFEELPEYEAIEKLAHINCAAIMFPYLRETIADLSRRAGFPTLHLQPVNFARMYTEVKVKKENSKKEKASGE